MSNGLTFNNKVSAIFNQRCYDMTMISNKRKVLKTVHFALFRRI